MIFSSKALFYRLLFLISFSEETGLFGVPLTVLLENDQKKIPGIKVPLIFQKVSRTKLSQSQNPASHCPQDSEKPSQMNIHAHFSLKFDSICILRVKAYNLV